MSNNTNAQLKAYHVENSSLNDMNSSVKAQNSSLYSTNSSFNGKVFNITDKINKIVRNLSIFGAKKNDVTGAVTHFSTSNDSKKQSFTSDDKLSLLHDTLANRQAIAALYSSSTSTPYLTSQSNQRKITDTTDVSDDEVTLIPSIELSDTACDISGTINLLDDIGSLLWIIYQEEITPRQAISMARLSHDSTDTWADLLCNRLNTINKSLAQSTFGTEVAE